MEPVLNYINGEFVSARSGKTLKTVNPATGDIITTVAQSDATDVQAATAAALEARASWGSTSMEDRIAWLHTIADALEAEAETIAQLESLDTGKPIALARRVDAARSVAISDSLLSTPLNNLNKPSKTTGPSITSTVHRSAWSV